MYIIDITNYSPFFPPQRGQKSLCQLGRTTFNVLRVLSRVLTDKTSIRDLFKGSETIEDTDDETVQLQFEFKF